MYSSLDSLPLQMTLRTLSSRISAPPPGSESSPLLLSLDSNARGLIPLTSAMCFTSTAESDFMCM